MDDDPDNDDNGLPIEEAQQLVRMFSGDDAATLSDPGWLNTARYRHGLARTYHKGRTFLIGDAVRSAPPLYGQGMNYALQAELVTLADQSSRTERSRRRRPHSRSS